MLVSMLVSRNGSPDGISVKRYPAGEIVEVPDHLAEIFLRQGWAEPVKVAPKGKRPAANKAKQPAETKADELPEGD